MKRIWTVGTSLLLGTCVAACASQRTPGDEFELVKGQGTEVCDAYLLRLNKTEWQEPPYCGRPESNEPSGFETLSRVPLNASEVVDLIDRVNGFTHSGTQDQKAKENAERRKLGLPERGPLLTLRSIQSDLRTGQLRVWRYAPPVDIDNDGTPDRVVVWHGMGASHGDYLCGSIKDSAPRPQVQLIYLLEPDTSRIDEAKTRAVFGRKTKPRVSGEQTPSSSFTPLGRSMSVVRYKGDYYFDTFFSSDLGDFNGKRRSSRSINDTLALMERRGNQIRQMCEFRWHRPATEKR